MDEKQQRSALIGVGILVLAGVVYFFLRSSDDTPAEQTSNAKSSCVIAAASVPFFVDAVTKGRASSAVDSIGGVLTGSVCVKLFEDLQANPDETSDIPLQVDTSSGRTPPQTFSLPDLTTPPPQPSDRTTRIVNCFLSYSANDEALLLQLCYDGYVEPRTG